MTRRAQPASRLASIPQGAREPVCAATLAAIRAEVRIIIARSAPGIAPVRKPRAKIKGNA